MNIVSIDFDIIMAPSIGLYQNLYNKKYENYYQHIFNADLNIYNQLTNWLLEWAPQVGQNNILFIESHEQIINFIPQADDITIINIDHHHDLGYGNNENIVEKNNLDCGNWGLYLFDQKLINSYIWIKNPNSENCIFNRYNFNMKTINNYDLSKLAADKIIICLSSPWVPEQYHPLFYNWMNIIGKINNTQYYLIENK